VNPGTVSVGFLDPGQWSASFGLSLVELYLADAHSSRRIVPDGKQLRNYCGTGGLVAGRNEIAAQFLDATDSEWLFMVDSDMGFAPDTVERLLAAADPVTRPVMGGLCFALRRSEAAPLHATRYVSVPTVYDFVETDTEVGFLTLLDYPRDEVITVAATGAACLLVHRSALTAVRDRAGDHWFDPVTHPRDTTFSEDLSFCVRLAAAGIALHVDTGVKTSHHKGGVYLDEAHFDAQRIPEAVS
jgi:GT2 family glycosyltransferase